MRRQQRDPFLEFCDTLGKPARMAGDLAMAQMLQVMCDPATPAAIRDGTESLQNVMSYLVTMCDNPLVQNDIRRLAWGHLRLNL